MTKDFRKDIISILARFLFFSNPKSRNSIKHNKRLPTSAKLLQETESSSEIKRGSSEGLCVAPSYLPARL